MNDIEFVKALLTATVDALESDDDNFLKEDVRSTLSDMLVELSEDPTEVYKTIFTLALVSGKLLTEFEDPYAIIATLEEIDEDD